MSGDRVPRERPPALEIKDLIVRYGKGEDVLRGVSLELQRHETVGLIGASGSGKSTLLRAVHRLVEPAAGTVILDGVSLSGLAAAELRQARLRMGMIFQEHALVGRLTVMENVLSGRIFATLEPRLLREGVGALDIERDAFSAAEFPERIIGTSHEILAAKRSRSI